MSGTALGYDASQCPIGSEGAKRLGASFVGLRLRRLEMRSNDLGVGGCSDEYIQAGVYTTVVAPVLLCVLVFVDSEITEPSYAPPEGPSTNAVVRAVASYAAAMRCPVLTYAMTLPGCGELQRADLSENYAGSNPPPSCYQLGAAKSTALARALSTVCTSRAVTGYRPRPSYALATRCPVLTYAMLLPGGEAAAALIGLGHSRSAPPFMEAVFRFRMHCCHLWMFFGGNAGVCGGNTPVCRDKTAVCRDHTAVAEGSAAVYGGSAAVYGGSAAVYGGCTTLYGGCAACREAA
eukprot:1134012-Rhodomonas_salina.5